MSPHLTIKVRMKNQTTGTLYVSLALCIISLSSISSVASENVTNANKNQSENVSLNDHFFKKAVAFCKKHKTIIATGTILAGATLALASIIKIKFLPSQNQLPNNFPLSIPLITPLSNDVLDAEEASHYLQIIKEITPWFHAFITKLPEGKLIFKRFHIPFSAQAHPYYSLYFNDSKSEYSVLIPSVEFSLGCELRNFPRDEQKFILAHEIGHVLLVHVPSTNEEAFLQEFRADEFAAKATRSVDGGINSLQKIINVIDPGHPTPQARINALEGLRYNTEPFDIELHRNSAALVAKYCVELGFTL